MNDIFIVNVLSDFTRFVAVSDVTTRGLVKEITFSRDTVKQTSLIG